MKRSPFLLVLILALPALGEDTITPDQRKEAIATIKKKSGLDKWAETDTDLKAKLWSAKNGTINTALTKTKLGKTPGVDKNTYKSVKERADAIAAAEKAIITYNELPDTIIKKEQFNLGFLNNKIDSVGRLNSYGSDSRTDSFFVHTKSLGIESTIKSGKIIDKDSLIVDVAYLKSVSLVIGPNSRFKDAPPSMSAGKISDLPTEHRFVVTGVDTTKLVDGPMADIKGIFYIVGNTKYAGETLLKAVKFTLTDEERESLDPRPAK